MKKLVFTLALLLSTNVSSATTFVYNVTKDEVLHEYASERVRPIASVTKLMTAIIVIESGASLNEKVSYRGFLGKKELFDGSFGWFFKKVGGIPVNRSSATGLVEQVANEFSLHPHFILAMSPEGTRQKVDTLKTGFYHIAKAASVPVLPIGFDFSTKEVIIGALIYPTNETADIKKIISFFAACKGKYPEKGVAHLV